jgi:hypothetical protein
VECGTGVELVQGINCPDNTQDGRYDPSPDKIIVAPQVLLPETQGATLYQMDSTDTLLFWIKQSAKITYYTDTIGVVHSVVQHKDQSDTIHIIDWVVNGSILNIKYTTEEPRVWGQPVNAGRVVGHNVYRTGVITTTNSVLRAETSGYTIISETVEQRIGEFLFVYNCNSPFTDPFMFDLDNGIVDSVEHQYVGSDGTWIPD